MEDTVLSEEEMEGLVSSPEDSAESFVTPSRRMNQSNEIHFGTSRLSGYIHAAFRGKRKFLLLFLFILIGAMIGISKNDGTFMEGVVQGNASTGNQSVEIKDSTFSPTLSPVQKKTSHPTKSPTTSPSHFPTISPTKSKVIIKGGDENVIKEDDETDEEARKEALIKTWGKWHFWDGDPDSRPTEDYMAKYPNRDCPFDEFPDTAWQADAVYVNHLLDSAGELVSRVREAIYTEYGWGPRETLDHDGLKARMDMFHLSIIDLDDDSIEEPIESLQKGGWIAKKSFKALSRRILHAMMTGDTFTVVLGGDSSAAGHGNHFHQSYMMQFHAVLQPLLARLGVKLITRNCAQEDLGTLHHSLGFGSMYGDDIDIIVWDSNSTETEISSIGMFYRQALLSGKRTPVLWGGPYGLLKEFYNHADADVMAPGNAMAGVKETRDNQNELPFAIRYLKCAEANKESCENPLNKYRGTCWIERKDVIPPTMQLSTMRGQSDEHPGFRFHQIKARAMTIQFLDAMQDAIDTWSEVTIVEGHPLPDEYWHITDHYTNIKSKVIHLDHKVGNCDKLKEYIPERVCNLPLNARGEFTPRADPSGTSLRTILKSGPYSLIPNPEVSMLYDGPDVQNPNLHVPYGEIDTVAIAGLRRQLGMSSPKQVGVRHPLSNENDPHSHLPNLQQRILSIEAGKGWEFSKILPGNCDGSFDAICGRLPSSNCLLYGHMDSRGGIIGDELSGWLVFNIPDVKDGIIVLKIETNHKSDKDLSSMRSAKVHHRKYDRSSEETTPLPADFILDYAVDGVVTSVNLNDFKTKLASPQKNVELLTVMDDAMFQGPKDVEVAIRMRNCGRDCTFLITHVYWA